ncbi:KIF-binding protein [Anabrus simplex]|uniref:KIF-binding protein n=1 Tax=Anabrus simplex TaxID=316456 RepID=UPI0034DD470C
MASTSVNKEVLIDLQEKYEKVRKLLEEDSKRDPETEPYRSKYAASKILTAMKTKLVKILDDNGSDSSDYLRLKAMLGVVWLNLGTVSVDTEELSTGEEQLSNCVESLSDHFIEPECIIVVLSALNQLGILWSQRDQPKRSQEYLEKAEKLYKDYTTEVNTPPVDIHDLFCLSDSETPQIDSETSLEKIHTLTLYYLAQIYGSLNDHLKSAVYCHTTLRRQLESKEFDSIEWSLNAATLSQYFMEKNGFNQARHHLAAASYILDQYENELSLLEGNEEDIEAKRERFKHRSADVARCWAKYGLMLLMTSKERLMSSDEDENGTLPSGSSVMEMSVSTSVSQDEVSHLWFTTLELSSYEDQITDQYCLTYDDARKVFLSAQEWLNKAKQYYTLDNHASDYVQIVQDLSQLYKYLVFFEDDEERQSRMHKRRIDHLESVLRELNPQYYLLVCRQLWYELAETYSDMLDIKLTRLQATDERPTPHALRKVNYLAEQGIANFNKFLDSLRDHSTKEMPEELSEELVRPTLIACFHVGRLYGKIIVPDKKGQLENLRHSLEAYQFLVNYCDKHQNAQEQMGVELGVCRDMVGLLPLKIDRLSQEAALE